jgi:hypothetical protein
MMGVQITGPRSAIERVLRDRLVPAAQRRDCHARVWIEAPEVPAGIAQLVESGGCKVHHTQLRL